MAASAVSPVKRLVSPNSSTHAESNPLSREPGTVDPSGGCDANNNNNSGVEHKTSGGHKSGFSEHRSSLGEHKSSSSHNATTSSSGSSSLQEHGKSSSSLQEGKSEGKSSSSGGRRKISLPSWFRQTSSAGSKSKLTRQHTIDSPGNFHARFLRKQVSSQAAQRLQVGCPLIINYVNSSIQWYNVTYMSIQQNIYKEK